MFDHLRPEQQPFSRPLQQVPQVNEESFSGEDSSGYDNPLIVHQLSKGTEEFDFALICTNCTRIGLLWIFKLTAQEITSFFLLAQFRPSFYPVFKSKMY